MRPRPLSLALVVLAVVVAVLGALPALGADHRDAPLTKAAPRSDLNDVYLFRGASGKPVFVMTVNPLTTPADTASLRLDPATLYEFKVDIDGDAQADVALKFRFSGTGPVQDFSLMLAQGSQAVSNDPVGTTVLSSGKTSTRSDVTVNTDSLGHKIYVGPRDDPFFFDLAGFLDHLHFTGVDTFKGTNVTAIVVELPDFPAGSQTFGIWATTAQENNLGTWTQLDRMGRPAIATVFIPADEKDAFNNNQPDRDKAIYTDEVKAVLEALNSPSVDALADLLLPDILTVDFSKPIGYLNGRALADDVIDISLQAITGNPAAGDKVNANDRTFSAAFPYLADPNGPSAPGAPNTGSGVAGGSDGYDWTMPAGFAAAAVLLAAAGFVSRRKRA